jgi:hypothetical protein
MRKVKITYSDGNLTNFLQYTSLVVQPIFQSVTEPRISPYFGNHNYLEIFQII